MDTARLLDAQGRAPRQEKGWIYPGTLRGGQCSGGYSAQLRGTTLPRAAKLPFSRPLSASGHLSSRSACRRFPR